MKSFKNTQKFFAGATSLIVGTFGIRWSPGLLQIGGILIQWGTVSIPLSNVASASLSVAFPETFSGTPNVQATMNANSSTYIAGTGAVTSTSFTALGFHRAGTASTVTLAVAWFAIGPGFSS